jgi:hypothetical protein
MVIFTYNLKTTIMTNQEKWDLIVQKIEDLGDELQELVESIQPIEEDETDELYSFPNNIDNALLGLRMSVDELKEQELED